MRLICARTVVQDGTISFEEFYSNITPNYAILSHTWSHLQEVTYAECNSSSSKSKLGHYKIHNACILALRDGIEYVWVDTCCIDKSSSAELTEAINSMFAWYQNATICFVYLSDLADIGSLESCRWFRRGWTLQELIAPRYMKFFDQTWNYIGSKGTLATRLSEITSIDIDVLNHKAPLSSVCVAKRFSWAANRETTRSEDSAYCLLGIFNINMPLLYGEGQGAFRRLQEEIVQSVYDLSLLAWTPSESMSGDFCGFFAESVKDFSSCSSVYSVTDFQFDEGEMEVTNKGLKLRTPEYILAYDGFRYRYALKLNCMVPGHSEDFLTVPMRKLGPNTFIRARAMDEVASFDLQPVLFEENELHTITLLTKLPTASVPRGLNIVSSSRHTLVQIELPPQIPQDGTHESPLKCWDVEDCAFFGNQGSLQNWGAMKFGKQLMFLCFWRRLLNLDWTFEGTLLTTADKGFDDLSRHLFLFAEEFGYQAPTVADLYNDLCCGREHITSVRSKVENKWNRIWFNTQRVDDLSMCSGPRWRVQIFMSQG
ncbi:heterokaryon incompatibility protein-domain-containing protein [Ilyonectria robusta]|uniref:heterokaryon incompatibility protein-domain-containing protein n=1 Tax=Ilyonectria robusta TaxID=1079257 RepID=UPI001E8CC652|nr:heterokaryon incompatibility protein-domain-containing protein [Ilyonectria robusta]KAH8734173.1 heterokaryon incompatibility protein-domain-containing protein [Ilyonectria robusta]